MSYTVQFVKQSTSKVAFLPTTGGRVQLVKPPSTIVTFSDNFNRANGPIGENYDTYAADYGTYNVVNNAATSGLGSGGAPAYGYTGNTVKTSVAAFGADQEAEFKIITFQSFTWAGPIVRGDPTAATGYAIYTDNRAGTNADIRRLNGQSTTALANSGFTVAVGDTIRLRAQGNTLTAYVNNTLVATTTDNTHASGQPGLFFLRLNSAPTTIDDFFATSL